MKCSVRAEVLSAVLLEIQTDWDVMLCFGLVAAYLSKAVRSLELSETVHPMTHHHIPEGSKLNTMDSYEIHIVCVCVCVMHVHTHTHTHTHTSIF